MDLLTPIDAVDPPTAFSPTQDQKETILNLCRRCIADPSPNSYAALREYSNRPENVSLTRSDNLFNSVVDRAAWETDADLLKLALSQGGVAQKSTLLGIMGAIDYTIVQYDVLKLILSKNPEDPFNIGPMAYITYWNDMLMGAVTDDKILFVELFLDHQALELEFYGREYINWRNQMPLAVETASIPTARAFIEHGAYWRDPNVVARAARAGKYGMVKYLLDGGSVPNELVDNTKWPVYARPEKISSALNEAIRHKHNAIVELLLGNGADANLKDVDGWTPLPLAIESGNVQVVEMLKRYGAAG